MKHSKLLTLTALVATSVGLHQTVSAAQIKSVEAAKSIALKDLGLSASQVHFKEVDLEKGMYEIETVANNSEFDYKINGITGQIMKKKVEAKKAGNR
ncbi:TPA: PepSY domain-containing protein [Streptococcus suis]